MSAEYEYNRALERKAAGEAKPRKKRRGWILSAIFKLVLVAVIATAGWYLWTKRNPLASAPSVLRSGGTGEVVIEGQDIQAEAAKVVPDDGSDRFLVVPPPAPATNQ